MRLHADTKVWALRKNQNVVIQWVRLAGATRRSNFEYVHVALALKFERGEFTTFRYV